jgi:hypothetical protein
VLEALGKSRGPEDMRSAGQRYHDALQEGWVLNGGSRVGCQLHIGNWRVTVT